LTKSKADLLQGTLDMLILNAPGPLHGYGFIQRIRQLTKAGSKLSAEEESWDRLVLAIAKVRKAV